MIIDVILDRKHGDNYNEECIRDLYDYATMDFNFWYLSDALDNGDNKQIQQALCKYIDENGYNPDIKNYINSQNWVVKF